MLDQIKQIFANHNIDWVEPYLTTEGAINRKEAGMHRGLYYIYPEKNFYFGKAATNTVYKRHTTHRAKLDVDFNRLYGPPVEKKQPKYTFPEGWKDAIRTHIIEDTGPLPEFFIKTKNGTVLPGTLDHQVTHKVDVDSLPVLLWNLDHLTAEQIGAIEEDIIVTIWPYANDETYRRRLQAKK